MNHLAETREAPTPVQGLKGGCQYLPALLILIIYFYSGLIDWQFLLFGLLILYILSPFTVTSPRLDVPVAATSEGSRGRAVPALEQGPNESLAVVPTPSLSPVPLPSFGPSRRGHDAAPRPQLRSGRHVQIVEMAASPAQDDRNPLHHLPTLDHRHQPILPPKTPLPRLPLTLGTEPRSADDVVLGHGVETQDVTQLRIRLDWLSIAARDRDQEVAEVSDSLSRLSVTDVDGRTVSKTGSGSARKGALRSPRCRSPWQVAKLPRPERSSDHKARIARLKATAKRTGRLQRSANQQPATDICVEADGGMVGVEVEERVDGGDRSLADGDSMEGVIDGDGDEELADAEAAEIPRADEEYNTVMIGSDVDGEMELDDETPASSGDSKVIDGDSMDLEEDAPPAEAKEAGDSKSMEIGAQSDHGKVNKETLQDKIRGEKATLASRQASTIGTNGSEMGSSSAGATARPSQQPAASASVAETEVADPSPLHGVAQHLISTNSAADLREARRGKRPESRATPPASPLPTNMASTTGSAKPASGNDESAAPKKQPGKRGCGSSGDEKPDDGAGQAKQNQTDESPPAASSRPRLSATRQVLLAKRNARGKGTANGRTDNSRNSTASGPSTAAQPSTVDPPQSSKRAMQTKPEKADSDDDIVPLKDIPDKTLTEQENWAQYMEAAGSMYVEPPDTDEEDNDNEKS